MNIAYLSVFTSLRISNWSGLDYSIFRALGQQGARIDFIGRRDGDTGLPLTEKITWRLAHALGKRYLTDRSPAYFNALASQAQAQIRPDADILFSPGTGPFVALADKRPKVFYTDAVFAGMIDYYPAFTNLSRASVRAGNAAEQAAIDNADLCIFASDWAADWAMRAYGTSPGKVAVVPFGANLEPSLSVREIRAAATAKASDAACNLLFPGVDWERKGGDRALQIARKLNEAGIKTTLHVAGVNAIPVADLPDYVVNHGYLDKNNNADARRMEELFDAAHFMVLPSRAECAGVVFSEAGAFGVPAIATDTGGIPTFVKDHLNGKIFPGQAVVDGAVDFIRAQKADPGAYIELACSSYNEFSTRLNWTTSGSQIMNLLKKLVQ